MSELSFQNILKMTLFHNALRLWCG